MLEIVVKAQLSSTKASIVSDKDGTPKLALMTGNEHVLANYSHGYVM